MAHPALQTDSPGSPNVDVPSCRCAMRIRHAEPLVRLLRWVPRNPSQVMQKPEPDRSSVGGSAPAIFGSARPAPAHLRRGCRRKSSRASGRRPPRGSGPPQITRISGRFGKILQPLRGQMHTSCTPMGMQLVACWSCCWDSRPGQGRDSVGSPMPVSSGSRWRASRRYRVRSLIPSIRAARALL